MGSWNKTTGTLTAAAYSFLILAFLGIIVPWNSEVAVQSPIRLTPSEVFFGEVRAGTRLMETITVENTSQYSVELIAASTSCDCASTDFAPGKLPAFNKKSIHVSWTPGRGDGPSTRQIRIAYKTDRGPGIIDTVLHATIIPDYRVSPQYLLIDPERMKPITWEVFIRPVGNPELQVLNATSSDPSLKVATPMIKDKTWIIKVSFFPGGQHNRVLARWDSLMMPAVIIATNSPQLPTYQVPLLIQSVKEAKKESSTYMQGTTNCLADYRSTCADGKLESKMSKDIVPKNLNSTVPIFLR